jgi:general L-amino acid transport system substrate-binding protein
MMRRGIFARLIVLVMALVLVATACDRGDDTTTGTGENGEGQQQAGGNALADITGNGTLRCGVNETVPGFGFGEGDQIDGFDIDFCRAFAIALLGEATDDTMQLVPVVAEERFNALRAGEYDILVRNTTFTASRDGAEGVDFLHPNFYDGQAMMVRTGQFSSIDEMAGTSICVTTGTTTELNLEDYFSQRDLDYDRVGFEENPQLQEAFIQERCDGWTSDASQLAGIRSQWPQGQGGPESVEILADVMSKEPLAPAVVEGENELRDALNWVIQGLILAEELGVNSNNIDRQVENPDSAPVASMLGVAFEGGESPDFGLGLENDAMQNVIRELGNYGEIFDRHLGTDTPLGLERGLNALWTEGGIQYAMPFR